MCMNVDLPEPDGPTMVTNSAGGDRHGDAAQGMHHVIADVILLRELVNVDHQSVGSVGLGRAASRSRAAPCPAYA